MMRRYAFDVLDQSVNPQLGVYLHEPVNLVGHHFQRDHFGSLFRCGPTNQGFAPLRHIAF
jgi:hypothetical protein